jgi:hypothetical protein
MQTFKQILFTGWNFMRWLRLIIGIIFAVQGIQLHDSITGFIGAFFLFQAITNTGCCGVGGCSVPGKKRTDTLTEDAQYEEVK